MLRYLVFYFGLVLYGSSLLNPIYGAPKLPPEMDQHAKQSIINVYKEEFEDAKRDAKNIIKQFPDHPAGYFFYAAIIYFHMQYLQSTDEEEEFYDYCDRTILKGGFQLKKNPDDVWSKFFLAGAYGFKGKYESDYEKWVTSFKHGWQGAMLFREVIEKDSTLYDAYFGIAMYGYWRSAKSSLLWWMPGITDERKKSIEQMVALQVNGVYTRENAMLFLTDMYQNEKQYMDALGVIGQLLNVYPNNLLCQWRKAHAQYFLQDYSGADSVVQSILYRVEEGPFANNSNAVLAHLLRAKICFAVKDYDRCLKEILLMRVLKLTTADQKRLERFLNEGIKIEKDVNAIIKK